MTSRGPAESASAESTEVDVHSPENAVEITLLCGSLDGTLREFLRVASRRLERRLEIHFGSFEWTLSIRYDSHARSPTVTNRLERAVSFRDRQRQDFVILIEGSLFRGSEGEEVVCATSKTCGVALLSLEPFAVRSETLGDGSDHDLLVELLVLLLLRLLGVDSILEELVSEIRSSTSLELAELALQPRAEVDATLEEHRAELLEALTEVADPRLEEHRRSYQWSRFVILAISMNLVAILQNVRAARPWLLPFRVKTLTAAAISAALFLLMTAEAWDLALQQSVSVVTSTTLLVLLALSAVLFRSQMMKSPHGRLTEQIITTNASLGTIVVMGVSLTYVLLFVLVLGAGLVLFPDHLVQNWATSLGREVLLGDRLVHALITATIALGIGLLGASLEGVDRLRSVVYVDEHYS